MKKIKQLISTALKGPVVVLFAIGTVAGIIYNTLEAGFYDGPEAFVDVMISWGKKD